MNERNSLFIKYDLRRTIDNINSEISQEINSYDTNYILSVKLDEICDHLVDKHTFEIPTIFPDQVEMVDQGETHIPSEQFGRRVNLNANFFVFALPFTGDGNLFHFRASTLSSATPSGVVKGSELHLKFVRTGHNGEAIKRDLEREIQEISKHLSWIKRDANEFHSSLRPRVMRLLELRKEKLLKDKGLVESLGIPIRKRDEDSYNFSAPIKERKFISQSQKHLKNRLSQNLSWTTRFTNKY